MPTERVEAYSKIKYQIIQKAISGEIAEILNSIERSNENAE